MKNGKNSRLLTTTILVVIIAVLSGVMITTAFNTAKNNSIQHMYSMAEERAIMVDNFVNDAEKTLSIYSSATEIINAISNPENEAMQQAAQEYTERFSSNISYLEGIYASLWTTEVLVHTNSANKGLVTRKDEAPRKALHDSLLAAGNGVYNTGIIISPAPPNKQIVSMYKAVYNEAGEPIGLVGLGIFTDGLLKSFDSLNRDGMENAVYNMVDTNDYKYIFVENLDESKNIVPYAISENDGIVKKCDEFKGSSESKTGYFQYKDDSQSIVSTYQYMGNRGWLLMIDMPKSDINRFATRMTIFLSIFCLVTLLIIIMFNIIGRRQELTTKQLATSLEKNKKTRDNLSKAVMMDILTETNTRIAFLTEYEDVPDSENEPYYFIMTSLSHLSDINSRYGYDFGDMVLVNIADALKKEFTAGATYRTGSDEFITVIKSTTDDPINSAANKVLTALSGQLFIKGQNIQVNCEMAIVKKGKNINSSIINQLKTMIKTNNGVPFVFRDADHNF